MFDRRALLGFALATPVAAALPRADADLKESLVRWPIGADRQAHGFMAVPARAHGAQPAVLLIGDAGGSDLDDRVLVRALAQAGFVACARSRVAGEDGRAAMAAWLGTVTWLGGNRYATGRVGAVGIGSGAQTVATLLRQQTLKVGAGLGTGLAQTLWLEADGAREVAAGSAEAPLDWPAAWAMLTAFLRGHLA